MAGPRSGEEGAQKKWQESNTWDMLGPVKRLTSGFTVLIAVLAVLLPAQAMAVNPEQTGGGAGSKWFSGSLLQQSGLNCTIIGGSYSETMVSAIAGFGGTGGSPPVRDAYHAP